MPLIFAKAGELLLITRVNAREKDKKHLQNLGISVGCKVNIVTNGAGDVILKVKDSRIAINKSLASKIIVEEVNDEIK